MPMAVTGSNSTKWPHALPTEGCGAFAFLGKTTRGGFTGRTTGRYTCTQQTMQRYARPMPYTLGQAAKATGKDRATISRAIKKGKISAEKDSHGQWAIDPAELHRVYPPIEQDNSAQQLNATDNATTRNTDLLIENRELKAKLEAANEREKLKDQMLDDTRTDRDKWRQQASALLTDQRENQEQPKGWWRRVFGG